MGLQKEFGADGRVKMLKCPAPPPGPWTRPQSSAVEVRFSDGTWRGATVRAWAHPPGGYPHLMSAGVFPWLVHIEFPEGLRQHAGWYCFESVYLRRV